MDKSLVLNKIKEHLGIRFDKEFASFLDIKTTTLAMWYKRNTYDIELLFKKCEYLNPEWLLTGNGVMLKEKEEVQNVVSEPIEIYGLDYKELYLREKQTVDLQNKYIATLEFQLNNKSKAG